MSLFDDAALDADATAQNAELMHLAQRGARLRQAGGVELIGRTDVERPRAVIALGAEARLIRAVVEPVSVAPFVAWPAAGLPRWVGALDLVILIDSTGQDHSLIASAQEAIRRGCVCLIAAPETSELVAIAASSTTIVLKTLNADPTVAAIAVLRAMHSWGLAPAVDLEAVADAADAVAQVCGPSVDVATNPAKALAMAMADETPLIWGSTVLASRAGRRIAEGVRQSSSRLALAADATDIGALLLKTARRDPFSDPFEDGAQTSPMLVVCSEPNSPRIVSHRRVDVMSQAKELGIRVFTIEAGEQESPVAAYVAMLQQGLFASAYLGIGLAGTSDVAH